jgi:tetratricopeptide (TPR) repeat protein
MLGQVQLARGQNADAVASYQQWVKLQPESSAAHANLGLAMEAAGDLPGANEHIKQSNRAESLTIPMPSTPRGRSNSATGAPHKHSSSRDGLEKRAPKSTVGFTLEGDALTAQKQYAAAVLAYENALKIASTGSIIQRLHHAQVQAPATPKGRRAACCNGSRANPAGRLNSPVPCRRVRSRRGVRPRDPGSTRR